jgi:hypothetical protein
LSWFSGFGALSLWRLREAQLALLRQGVRLLNPSGLLNLVAWAKEMNGHLVSHRELPESFGADGAPGILWIPTNANRSIRHSVLEEWNPRRVLDTSGAFVYVRKLGRSRFVEDNYALTYAAIDELPAGRLRGVHVTDKRAWWIEIGYPEAAARDVVFEFWKVLCAWLAREAPLLDQACPSLPAGPLSFLVDFRAISGEVRRTVAAKDEDALRALIAVTASRGHPMIHLDIGEGFEDGLVQPETVAERVLVECLVTGAAMVAGSHDVGESLQRIVKLDGCIVSRRDPFAI